MTADAVGGVWSYALGLCAALPDVHFILATLGPRPRPAQRAALARLANVTLAESDFPLEWMPGGQTDIAASHRWLEALARRHAVDRRARQRLCPGKARLRRPDCGRSFRRAYRGGWPCVARGPGRVARLPATGYRRAARRRSRCRPDARSLDDLRQQYGLPLANALVIPNGIDVNRLLRTRNSR